MIEGVQLRDVDKLCAKARELVVDMPTSPSTDAGAQHQHQTKSSVAGQPAAAVRPSAGHIPDPDEVQRRNSLDRRIRLLATGLVNWGYTKREAEEAVSDAYCELEQAALHRAGEQGEAPPEITDEEILRAALFKRGRDGRAG